MTISINNIIKEVKYAVDDDNLNLGAMETRWLVWESAVIRSCAAQALRWLARNAPLWALADDAENAGFIKEPTNLPKTGNKIAVPDDFVRLARLRVTGWHRAVNNPIEETSDEYLMLYDETATATADRPVVAIIHSYPKKLELWPDGNTYEISYVSEPTESIGKLMNVTTVEGLNDSIIIPGCLHTSFIYYTAFLLLAGQRDNGAQAMLEIARRHLAGEK